jgi:hypothetical protein
MATRFPSDKEPIAFVQGALLGRGYALRVHPAPDQVVREIMDYWMSRATEEGLAPEIMSKPLQILQKLGAQAFLDQLSRISDDIARK